MTTSKDFINDLLHREHADLLKAFAHAGSEQELRSLGEQALSFASSLLLNYDPTARDVRFMDIPFWLVETPQAFWTTLWPELCDVHAIASPDPEPIKATDDDLKVAAGALQAMNLTVLCRKGNAAEIVGPILVLDLNSATGQKLISFLFHIALKRSAGPSDIKSLTPLYELFENDETREEAINSAFVTVLDSEEAQTKNESWQRL